MLSLVLILFLSSLFFPRGGVFAESPLNMDLLRSLKWLSLFGGGFGLGILSSRFPKAFGLPLLIIVLLLMIFLIFSISGYEVAGEDSLLEYRLLKKEDGVEVVRLAFPSQGEAILTLEGDGVSPEIEIVNAHDLLFIVPKGDLVRIPRLVGSDGYIYTLEIPGKGWSSWSNLFSELSKKLPFIEVTNISPEMDDLRIGIDYGLFLNDDGIAEWRLLSSL